MRRTNHLLLAANLLGLAGLAYLTASTINDAVSDTLWTVPQLPTAVDSPLHAPESRASTLSERSPFGSAPPGSPDEARPPPRRPAVGEDRLERRPLGAAQPHLRLDSGDVDTKIGSRVEYGKPDPLSVAQTSAHRRRGHQRQPTSGLGRQGQSVPNHHRLQALSAERW